MDSGQWTVGSGQGEFAAIASAASSVAADCNTPVFAALPLSPRRRTCRSTRKLRWTATRLTTRSPKCSSVAHVARGRAGPVSSSSPPLLLSPLFLCPMPFSFSPVASSRAFTPSLLYWAPALAWARPPPARALAEARVCIRAGVRPPSGACTFS